VGPTAEGVIPEPSVERLLAMGDWLKINGEAVYGTRPGPIQGVDWLRTTTKGDDLYLHVFDWPTGGEMWLPGVTRPVRRAYLLADPSRDLAVLGPGPAGLRLSGPERAPDAIDTVVAVT
jgi:alpha-L-fucosidase